MASTKYTNSALFATIVLVLSLSIATSNLFVHPARAETTYNLTISDFAFHPQSLIIWAGDTVVWTNDDSVIYTLWFVRLKDQTTYGLSEPILPGESWSWVFDEPGTLQYYSFERLWITGFIKVKLAGDVDGDGKVGYKDLFALAAAYCSRPGDPNWNQQCDFDGDGHVGYKDLFALAANYGKTYDDC